MDPESERAERVESHFEWPVTTAALLVIPVIVIEQSDVGQTGTRWRPSGTG